MLATVIRAQSVPPQLWIRGETGPPDSSLFNFQIDGNTVAYNIARDVAVGPYVLTPGVHTITETAGTGTNLANYRVTYSGDCTNAGSGQGAVTLAAGDAKTCVINRAGPPVLTIELGSARFVSQARSGDVLNGQLDGVTVIANAPVTQGGTWTQAVAVGRHTVAETAGTGTNLANYSVLIQGSCAPDGTVTVAQDGFVPVCHIGNAPASQLLFAGIVANLGQNSGATLQLIAADNSTVLQTVTLKKPGDPAWTSLSGSGGTFQLNPPLQFTDISSAVITLVPAGSGDTAQISQVFVQLGNTTDVEGVGTDVPTACVVSRQWGKNQLPVLTQSSPNLALSVDDPADQCNGLAAPVLSPPPGSYTCPQTVTITGPPNSPIFVTTDGSRPTARSAFYLNPLTVSSTETISAIVLDYQTSAQQSKMTSGRYVCPALPGCPAGQHCCSGTNSSGLCNAGCISTNIACKPLCSSGYKCCGAAGPNGACDDRCVPNSAKCP